MKTQRAMHPRLAFLILALAAALLTLSACAYRSPDAFEGPAVTIVDEGRTYYLPAAQVDEADFLARDFIKNTAADGSTMFIRVQESDEPPREWYWDSNGDNNASDDGGGDLAN